MNYNNHHYSSQLAFGLSVTILYWITQPFENFGTFLHFPINLILKNLYFSLSMCIPRQKKFLIFYPLLENFTTRIAIMHKQQSVKKKKLHLCMQLELPIII